MTAHFSEADLVRWRDAGPGADRDRVVRHLAECSACASRYADAIRARPLDAGQAEFDAAEFAAVGAAIPGRHAEVVPFARRRRWTWIAIPAAAAAVLVVAFAVPRMRQAERAPEAPEFRGAGIHALAPEGSIGSGAAFDWASGFSAPRYRIEVDGSAGRVYSGEFTAAPVPFPPALLQQLKPGETYSWTVTALDTDGQTIAVSERRTFTLTSR